MRHESNFDRQGQALPSSPTSEGARRTEILETAATLFASSGLRTSLKEIADACGILPGSLYHHFDSKEAIILELVQRYRDDLDRVAAEAIEGSRSTSAPVTDRIFDFGRAVAACGVRHRAALLLTLYEPPAVLGDELARQASQAPTAIEGAMHELLRQARAEGVIRSGVDLSRLGDRLCSSMLHVGVGVSHLTPGAEHVPEMRLGILLHGVADRTPPNSALDRSRPMRAVEQVIATGGQEWDDVDGRTAHLRAVARKEFGRRGFEATTMRDIAGAAGLSTGTVYRSFRSKDEILVSIMHAYSERVKKAWDAALSPDSAPLERLDALMWANIQLIERFSDEFRIQLAWLRQSPPSSPDLGLSFLTQLRQIKSLVSAGAKSGEIRIPGANADLRARSLFETTMFPPNIIRAAGARAAHALARDTVLRGALVRTTDGD